MTRPAPGQDRRDRRTEDQHAKAYAPQENRRIGGRISGQAFGTDSHDASEADGLKRAITLT
jgi:hypothetical protein